jgi:HD-GYP domain-containing protein (c-di-GMP phosphodiesterase class II)
MILSIQRGTLNDSEREIVNSHITVTIKMLEALPFPKHLQNVPEFAGGHHEKMDGTGYPRGLKREELSVQARIMAIADIFEALTATDRPYKKAKKLSECLKIMGLMSEDDHIDPDIFDIFIKQRVYMDYAEEFLDPELVDEIDETLIPGLSISA